MHQNSSYIVLCTLQSLASCVFHMMCYLFFINVWLSISTSVVLIYSSNWHKRISYKDFQKLYLFVIFKDIHVPIKDWESGWGIFCFDRNQTCYICFCCNILQQGLTVFCTKIHSVFVAFWKNIYLHTFMDKLLPKIFIDGPKIFCGTWSCEQCPCRLNNIQGTVPLSVKAIYSFSWTNVCYMLCLIDSKAIEYDLLWLCFCLTNGN